MVVSAIPLCFGTKPLKTIVFGFAAILLAGCSDSIEKYSSAYNNPSDADPVYTASTTKISMAEETSSSVPVSVNRVAASDDQIVQSPIANAPVTKTPEMNYSQAYAKSYNKPSQAAYPQPKLSYNAPAYKAPVLKDENNTDDDSKPVVKTKARKVKVTPSNDADADADNKPTHSLKAKPKAEEVVGDNDTTPSQTDDNAIVVAKGDTLFSIARQHKVSAFALADANDLPHDKPLKVGSKLHLPEKAAVATKADAPKEKPDADSVKTSAKDLGKEQVADATDSSKSDLASPTGKLSLRWPLKGRVISAFGPKSAGNKNEGINIAAPEGSKIRAADGGVVAYAGNELKGYGNLVLIRHEGGYVTAYAHAKELLVKKGDTVKRGDVVALVGQTGAVTSAQLHFEVRKGATALDPNSFLGSASASN